MFLVRKIIEWVLGFAVYLAFLTLSQSGSILQQLKTLFVGYYHFSFDTIFFNRQTPGDESQKSARI